MNKGHEHLPPGKLAVRRSAQAVANDGHAGRIDEFLVDPTNGHMIHLVLREAHQEQRDVTIPVGAIERVVWL